MSFFSLTSLPIFLLVQTGMVLLAGQNRWVLYSVRTLLEGRKIKNKMVVLDLISLRQNMIILSPGTFILTRAFIVVVVFSIPLSFMFPFLSFSV